MGNITITSSTVKAGNIAGDNVTTTTTLHQLTPEAKQALAPIERVIETLPADRKPGAAKKMKKLRVEVSKGDEASDRTLSNLVKGVADAAPQAASALATAFGGGALAPIAGVLTRAAIHALKG